MKLVSVTGVSLSLFVLVAASATEAGAQALLPAPVDCTSGRNLNGYNAGVASGTSLTNSAWTGVGQNPDRIDDLQSAITSALTTAASTVQPSPYATCRFKGTYDGTMARLGVLQSQVIQECVLDGSFIGTLTADLYCALSIALASLGGLGDVGTILRPVVGLCGTSFETSCDAEFNATCSAFPACGPFTNTQIANNLRDQQCTY